MIVKARYKNFKKEVYKDVISIKQFDDIYAILIHQKGNIAIKRENLKSVKIIED